MADRFEILRPDSASAAAAAAEILGRFCPPVRGWWEARLGGLTAPQLLAIPAIQGGRHTLVCAPTGSGKTLCAFITTLSDLFARHLSGALSQGIDTVYISPLKALGADITRNLAIPLEEIAGLLADGAGGHVAPPIRVAQRTGDSSGYARQKLTRRPPHILVTTPESLALCLAQPAMRTVLAGVRTIIIDEIHSVAGNKRGVDLALSVERLSTFAAACTGREPQRIGLSATIAPLEAMAEFLVGPASTGRTAAIADATFDRPLEIDIRPPFGRSPFATAAVTSKRVCDLLEEIIRAHCTTLVFTNTRAATERITFALRKRFAADPEQIQAHHSSLDRGLRLDIEMRLKAGTLRCVVCSTSLELGIDIGSIDRVVLLNCPKGISRALQRIGRSGHSHGATARGTFIPTVPNDLLEAIVSAQMARGRRLDAIRVPLKCLDVLAQQLIGLALERAPHGLSVDDAYALVRRTMPYAELGRGEFDEVVAFLATNRLDGDSPRGAKLLLEAGDPPRLLPLRRSVATLYSQNVGTITSEGHVRVKLLDGQSLGQISESYAALLKPGDRFVLSGRCVAFVHAQRMTVFVAPSANALPTVPRWQGQMLSMADGLAEEMRDFRSRVRAIAPAGPGAIGRMLMRQHQASGEVAALAAEFLDAQFRYADIPVAEALLVERVPDEDAIALVFHTMVGRAANEALARLVAYRMNRNFTHADSPTSAASSLSSQSGPSSPVAGGNATVVVDDYAFGIWVANRSAARRADRTIIRSLLSPANYAADLTAAVAASELFRNQFRGTALRAHAILQNRFAQRGFIGAMQCYAGRLHDVLVAQSPEHLLLRETRRAILEDILNAPAAQAFLERQSRLAIRLLDLPSPSPFAFGLFATSRRDTMQLTDTGDFLLEMYAKVQRHLAAAETGASKQPAQASLFS